MKKSDLWISLFIGELAALLILLVSQNLSLSQAVFGYEKFLPVLFPIFTFLVMLVGGMIGARAPAAYQFAKFLLVGGLNFLVDLGVLNLLISFTGVSQGASAIGFKVVSFSVANVWSFFWNKFWTFGAGREGQSGRQFIEFFTVSVIGLLLNAAVFALVNDLIGPLGRIPPKTWVNLSALAAAAAGLLWSFLGYKFFVFGRGRSQSH